MLSKHSNISRRSFFQKLSSGTAAIGIGSLITNDDLDAVSGRVNTNSQPSNLKGQSERVAKAQRVHIIFKSQFNFNSLNPQGTPLIGMING